MSDSVTLVENLRAFLARTDQVNTPELGRMAEQYAAAGRAVNERLLRCVDFLRRGLRSEAIHLAEMEPKLLDQVAVLDFVEFAQWELICATYGLTPPNAIHIEAAAQVNEAYSAELPLQGLLTRHRLAALSLAPLRERLGVLREIVAADPGSPAWADDLRAYEMQRVRQAAAEAREASERGDSAALEALGKELSGEWTVDEAGQLGQQVRAMTAKFRQKDVVTRLREMVPALHEAHGAMDLEGLRATLASWKELAKSAPGGVPAELEAEIAEASAWAKAEAGRETRRKEYESACLMLEEALEREAPDAELAELRNTAVRLGESLPAGLEARYTGVREARRLVAERRRRRNTLAVAAVVVAASGVSIWYVNDTLKSREAGRWAAAIRADVQAKRVEAASAKLAEVTKASPGLLSRPALASAAQEARAAEQQDAARASQFEAAIAKATGAGGADNAALLEARRLSRTDAERAKLEEATRAVVAATGAEQKRRDDAFAEGVKALQAKVAGLDAGGAGGEGFNGALEALEREAEELGRRQGLSPVVAATINPVAGRLKQLRSEHSAAVEREAGAKLEASLLERVRGSSTVPGLVSALEQVVRSASGGARAAEFQRSLAMAGQWQAVAAWGELRKGWGSALPTQGSEVGARLEAVKKYLADHKGSPLEAEVGAYASLLERASGVVSEEGQVRQGLEKLLALELLSGMRTVKMDNGDVYYLRSNAVFQEGEFTQFPAVISGDIEKTRVVSRKKERIKEGPREAPQVGWARRATERLEGLTVLDADGLMLAMASDAVATKDMDPLLQAILYQQLVGLAAEAGVKPDAKVARFLKRLEDFKPDQYPWMNPENEEVKKARDSAAALMRTAPGLGELIAEAAKSASAVVSAVDLPVAGVGVALRAGGEAWEVSVPRGVRDGARAMAAVPAAGGKAQLREVGTVRSGRFEASGAGTAGVPDGSPVFYVMEAK